MMKRAFVVCGALAIGTVLSMAGISSSDDHQRQVETMATLCRIGQTIEEYAIDHDRYPRASNLDELADRLVPRYVEVLHGTDGWGNDIAVDVGPKRYTIASCGKGAHGRCTPTVVNRGGAFTDPQTDIIFSNGVFQQWPAGVLDAPDDVQPGCQHLREPEQEDPAARQGK